MKNRIYSINQYLLERFPIAWNTRIVWMLSAALVVHLFFFLFGVVTLIDPVSLQGYNVLQSYFGNGMLFLGVVISLLLLVVWIVTLFRNNAFKNFYPTSPWDLFKQFCAYVVIIFACTSFYYSYTLGLQTYIKTVYPRERVDKEIRVANDSDMFRSESIYNYTLDQRILPIVLDTLYCETDEYKINTEQSHFKFKDELYQYYTFRKITIPKNDNDLVRVNDIRMYVPKHEDRPQNSYTQYQVDSLNSMSLRNEKGDSTITYYFKDKVVDMSNILKTAEPSYYNYTNIFYQKNANEYGYDDLTYYDDYGVEEQSRSNPVDSSTITQVKRYHNILDRNDAQQIKALLKDQLDLLDYYGVRHNLTVDTWFKMVYHPSNFPVKQLILNGKESIYENEFLDEDATAFMKYAFNLKSKRFMEKQNLHEVFENLDEVHNTNIFEGSIHFFMWMSFIIAVIIFIFRTTGLRELLFSIVASGVTSIIIGLICVLITYSSGAYGNEEYVFTYVPFIIGFTVFTITFLAYKSMRKLVSAIFLNITFVYLLPWLFLIVGIISMHQEAACANRYSVEDYNYEMCTTILEYVGILWSYIFIVAGFIWVFVYTRLVIKWRSLPER